jgi:hypothetical protein
VRGERASELLNAIELAELAVERPKREMTGLSCCREHHQTVQLVLDGYISAETAARDDAVVITTDGTGSREATARARATA